MEPKTGKEIMEIVKAATDEELQDIALNSPAFLRLVVEINTVEIQKLLLEIQKLNLELAYAISKLQEK